MPGDSVAPRVFVGGSGRSGTHVLGHLLNRHSRCVMIPRELIFHSRPNGLVGYVAGRVDYDDLVERLRGQWWYRETPWDPTVTRGLHKTFTKEQLDAAIEAGRAAPDRTTGARALLDTLLEPLLTAAGKPGWVEMSPGNESAPELLEIYPDARIVHIVRDGRDVACSKVKLPWGDTTIANGLRTWDTRLRKAEAAADSLGDGRVLVVHMEDLVLHDRDRTYDRVLEFVGVPDEPAMRSFFDNEVTAQRAHIGRWREEIPPEEQPEVVEMYDALLAELHADGIECAPRNAEVETSYGPSESEPPNPYDPWADGRAADA